MTFFQEYVSNSQYVLYLIFEKKIEKIYSKTNFI